MEVGPAFDSAFPLKGDSSRTSRHVRFVPRRDSCIAANRKAAAKRAEGDPSRINPTTGIADDCALHSERPRRCRASRRREWVRIPKRTVPCRLRPWIPSLSLLRFWR